MRKSRERSKDEPGPGRRFTHLRGCSESKFKGAAGIEASMCLGRGNREVLSGRWRMCLFSAMHPQP